MTAVPSSPEPSEAFQRRRLLILVALAAGLRTLLALSLDLTSFEAESWIAARSPAPGTFDHPPLWSWLVWLSTGGGALAAPIALRMPALLLGSATTLLLYRWTREMAGPAAAWGAAVLHSVSILFTSYGTLGIPGSSLCFFWLLSAYCGWKGFHPDAAAGRERLWILFLGLPLGLALLSGGAAFLLIPAFAGYLACDPVRRGWLKRPEPWIALGFAGMLYLPVLYWNYQHDWVYFRYQGWNSKPGFHPLHLLSLIAPLIYLNPPVAFSILTGLAALARRRPGRQDSALLLCWISLPAIVLLTLLSFFDGASDLIGAGVGFLTLIPIGALWLQQHPRLQSPVLMAAGLVALILIADLSPLHLGLLDSEEVGSTTGWRDLEPGLKTLMEEDARAGKATATLLFARQGSDAVLAEFNAGRRLGLRAACLGTLDEERGLAMARPAEFKRGCTGYFIVPSSERQESAAQSFRPRFKLMQEPRSIDVTRHGRAVTRFRVTRCEELLEDPPPAIPEPDLKNRLEVRLFFAVNRGWRSGAADVIVGGSNWLGVGYVGGPLALLVAVWHWRRHPERRKRDLIAILAASALCTVVVQPMKFGCARERPPRVFEAAVQRGEVDLHVMFGAKQGRGFPSGHTATAFLIATLVALILGRRGVAAAALAVAALVGLSTMYIGAHFPGDVVAGAWVGAISALMAFRAVALAVGDPLLLATEPSKPTEQNLL